MTGIERLRQMAVDFKSVKTSNHCTFIVNTWRGRYIDDAIADIADQIEREQDALVKDSPYDALPPDERDAIAWVREHGGIAYVRDAWNVRSNLDRQLAKERAKVERQQRHIEFVQRKCRERRERIEELNREIDELDDICGGESVKDTLEEALNLCATIGCEPSSAVGEELIWALGECTDIVSKRLMPDGMEWLVEAWPRFEGGEPVKLLDDFERYGEENGVSAVTMYADGSFALNCRAYSKGERVKRPAPKVLDADGVEIRVGDTVWDVEFGCEHVVTKVSDGAVFVAFEDESADRCDPASLTHRAPVFAADGRPLREGETVYHVADGRAAVVREVRDGGAVVEPVDGRPCGRCRADYLTHERPESKCRDCAHWQKDPTADNMGVCWFYYHEHEGQDCYAARRADIGACEEFMPRAGALAERERGE